MFDWICFPNDFFGIALVVLLSLQGKLAFDHGNRQVSCAGLSGTRQVADHSSREVQSIHSIIPRPLEWDDVINDMLSRQAFRLRLVPAVLDHPDWAASPEVAVAESISTIEQALLGESSEALKGG